MASLDQLNHPRDARELFASEEPGRDPCLIVLVENRKRARATYEKAYSYALGARGRRPGPHRCGLVRLRAWDDWGEDDPKRALWKLSREPVARGPVGPLRIRKKSYGKLVRRLATLGSRLGHVSSEAHSGPRIDENGQGQVDLRRTTSGTPQKGPIREKLRRGAPFPFGKVS